MPAGLSDDDIERTSEELWAKVFHPEVVAGVTSAQALLDSEYLAWLDQRMPDPCCDAGDCKFEATSAAICAHSGKVYALVCGAHREAMLAIGGAWRCKLCKHTGLTQQLVRWRPIFDGRSRA